MFDESGNDMELRGSQGIVIISQRMDRLAPENVEHTISALWLYINAFDHGVQIR